MKVVVTPRDDHPVEGHPGEHHDRGLPFTGHTVFVGSDGVLVDGDWVIKRDRRPKGDQLTGHHWLTHGIAMGWAVNWTGFTVEVQPND